MLQKENKKDKKFTQSKWNKIVYVKKYIKTIKQNSPN